MQTIIAIYQCDRIIDRKMLKDIITWTQSDLKVIENTYLDKANKVTFYSA
jgi:hypothetical protein